MSKLTRYFMETMLAILIMALHVQSEQADFLLKYGQPASIYVTVYQSAANPYTVESNPTIGVGDAQISVDGGSFTNLATLPDVYPAAHGQVRIRLSDSELQCRMATIFLIAKSPAVWLDKVVRIQTFGHDSASIPAIAADLVRIDGQTTVDFDATLNLKQLHVLNDTGHAIIATSTWAGGHGINCNGHAGAGFSAYDDATGNGIHAQSTHGDGIHAESSTGDGIIAQSDNGTGISAHSTNADGIGAYGGSGAEDRDIRAKELDSLQTTLTGPVDANLVSIDGETTIDHDATLRLKSLEILNSDTAAGQGTALRIEATGGNNIGAVIGGHGTEAGLAVSGGLDNGLGALFLGYGTGYGLSAVGGNTSVKDIDARELDSLVSKLPVGDISNLSLTDLIDGVSLQDILELVMAMVNGRFRINHPSTGKVTFYKRDNTTPLYTCTVTSVERTRD